MDIWLKPDNENKMMLIQALAAAGIIQEDLDELNQMDFSKPIAFHLDEPPKRIDFLTHLSGLNYDEANKMVAFRTYSHFGLVSLCFFETFYPVS